MAGLQRSTVSFRRQGSSGIVWDDHLVAELNQQKGNNNDEIQQVKTTAGDVKQGISPIKTDGVGGGIERSRSNGGGAIRYHRNTGRVSPAEDPPSPRLSAFGCCAPFGKKPPGKKVNQRNNKPPKHR